MFPTPGSGVQPGSSSGHPAGRARCTQGCADGRSRSSRAAPWLGVTFCTAFSSHDIQRALRSFMYFQIFIQLKYMCVCDYIKLMPRNVAVRVFLFYSTRDLGGVGRQARCDLSPLPAHIPSGHGCPRLIPPGRAQPGWDSEALTCGFGIYGSISLAILSLWRVLGKFVSANSSSLSSPSLPRHSRDSFGIPEHRPSRRGKRV